MMYVFAAAGSVLGGTMRITVSPPPDGRNAAPMLRDAIARAIGLVDSGRATRAEVLLEAGDYPLEPVDGDEYAILNIQGARNITIAGVGATTRLMVRDTSLNRNGMFRKVISVINTSGFEMRDLTIDFIPAARDWLHGIAGNVTMASPATVRFDLNPDQSSPPFRREMFGENDSSCLGIAIDEHGQPRAGFPDYLAVERIVPAQKGVTVGIARQDGVDYKSLLEGHRVVLMRRKPGEALFCFSGKNIHPVLRHIRVRASRGLMIEAYGCDRLELDHFRMERSPDQWLISPGDGLHYQGGVRGPYVHDSHFEALGDDVMNIYAKPFIISADSDAAMLKCANATDRVSAGDRLWIYAHSAPGDGELVHAAGVAEDGISGVTIRKGLTPDRAINLSRSGEDFIVRDNTFGPMRGIGCRVQAGDGVIEGNTFTRLSGPAISFECGLGNAYDEGPFPHDVVVRGNTFDQCAVAAGYAGRAVRFIAPWNYRDSPAGLPFRNLQVKDNTVVDSGGSK